MSNFNKSNNLKQIIYILLAIVVLSAAFYILLYKPKAEGLQNTNNKLEETISDIRNNQDVLRQKEELKREYKNALAKLEKKDQDQPIKLGQKSDLIVELNKLIDKTNVKLKTLQSIKDKKTNSAKYAYTMMPIEIQINGDYDKIIAFINQIEELKYLIKVNTLNLNTNLKSGVANQSTAEINAQINLVAFATNDIQRR